MSREKYSAQIKIDACERYLSGRSSGRELCQEYGFDSSVLREWTAKYRMHGAEAFWKQNGNKSYTGEFKKMVVEEYLTSQISLLQLTAKYNISSTYTVRSWIKKYNSNMELKDYEPKPEVYMAAARRKITKEERISITEYCIAHGCDYKGTAEKFDVSYGQVYSWVKKYKADGEDGLTDRRGHRKTEDELDELERLRRENLRLKRQLEEERMALELLKKVKEIERRR